MEPSKKPSYKYCMVPQCKNTTKKTPDKEFFRFPTDANVRKQWCRMMKRDNVSPLSCLYCCEDHFNMSTIRWGIVTAGKISHDFVNAFNTFPDIGDQKIVAVAARDVKKAADFAETHKIPKVFGSYVELAKSNDIDVAYIGALNPDHYNLVKLFIENDKHVLCEKPLCLNYKQVQSLVNFAKQKKKFLMEALWSRFAPLYYSLEKHIADRILGDISMVEASFGAPLTSVDRLNKKDLGGSTVLDIGIYTIQLAQFIFKDEPIKITAVGELNEDGVDIAETVILDYTGGRRAVLNITSKLPLWNKATISGSKGLATLEDPFRFPDKLTLPDGTVEEAPYHTSDLPYNFGDASSGLVYQAVEVAKCIREGLLESPRMPHKESLTLAKIEDTIRKQLGVHFSVDDIEYP